MNKFAGVFFGVVGVLCVGTALVIFTTLFQFYRFWMQDAPEEASSITIEITQGMGLSQIADALQERGVIASAFWFKVYAVGAGESKSIQAGSFVFLPGQNYATVADILGYASVDEVTITIPEGYTIAQIGELVVSRFDVTQEQWDQAVGVQSPFTNEPLLGSKPSSVDLEGYLFPDTYRFFAEATVTDIVGRLIGTLEARLAQEEVVFSDVACEGDCWWIENEHELLTLASIIQREVLNPDEMAMVADIFLKRLEIGMALQADSTVNYITGGKSPAISLNDRDIDSPYNTYQYAGLPPGPIANPGIDAIRAVLHPTPNAYFYFLTTNTGEVIYAVTHDQHVQNKDRYLR